MPANENMTASRIPAPFQFGTMVMSHAVGLRFRLRFHGLAWHVHHIRCTSKFPLSWKHPFSDICVGRKGTNILRRITHLSFFLASEPAAFRLMVMLCLMFLLYAATPGMAEETDASSPVANDGQQIERLEKRLQQEQAQREVLARERKALKAEMEEVSMRLQALAARRQALEVRLQNIGNRMQALRKEQSALERALQRNRNAISRLLAALQRMRRDPPPPFVTQPRDVLAAVRSAMMLSATIPLLDARAWDLLKKLRRLSRLRQNLKDARAELNVTLRRLMESRRAMMDLVARKKALLSRLDLRLKQQDARVRALARKARTLKELFAAIRREEERRRQAELERQRTERARLAAREKTERPKQPEMSSDANEEPTREPRVPHGKMHLKWTPKVDLRHLRRLPWPAQGSLVAGYGDVLPAGGHARGIYLATMPRATVVAPVDARVVMAGPFRSYGQLLILDAGHGYHILLAGLDSTDVMTGQVVKAGDPLGEMGSRPALAVSIGSSMERKRPILYMEVRRKGRTLDAGHWWREARKEARRR